MDIVSSKQTGDHEVNINNEESESTGNIVTKNNKTYAVNKDKVVEFISENSESEPIEVELKSTCTNFKMNSGTYHVLIMKNFVSLKENEHVQVEKEIIKCTKNEPRYDKNQHLVENLMYFETDKNLKANAHFYHTKQKVTIQGMNFNDISILLQKYFTTKISFHDDSIKEANRVFKFGTVANIKKNTRKPANKRKRTEIPEPSYECDICDQEFFHPVYS